MERPKKETPIKKNKKNSKVIEILADTIKARMRKKIQQGSANVGASMSGITFASNPVASKSGLYLNRYQEAVNKSIERLSSGKKNSIPPVIRRAKQVISTSFVQRLCQTNN